MNIVEVIRKETAALPPEHIAVRSDSGDMSYKELFQTLETIAGVLKEQGVAKGMCVGLAFPDCADYITISLALLSLDAVLVPVTVSSTPEVARNILDKTCARFLISPEPMLDSPGDRIERSCLSLNGGFHLARIDSEESLPEEFAEMEPAFIRFSSGTTGQSKGVLLSHSAIEERTAAADQALQITEQDVILWVLSMSFHFVVSILLFLRRGATICLCSEMFPFSFMSAAKRGDSTFIYATPFHYATLADSSLAPDIFQHVRMAVSTAMKLPTETAAAFQNRFGFGLTEAYGIIEVGLPFVNAAENKPDGSVGRALPGYEVEIRSPDADGTGEVFLRGPGMYAAYLHPWSRRDQGGWFATGDTGHMDGQGFLMLLGRTKNLINFAGMKVFPYEVEAVLNRFPGVRASLVYPEAHARYGQLPCARVEGDNLAPDALQRFCYENLESYKVPKKIEVAAHLERTESGKLKRNFEING